MGQPQADRHPTGQPPAVPPRMAQRLTALEAMAPPQMEEARARQPLARIPLPERAKARAVLLHGEATTESPRTAAWFVRVPMVE